MKSSSDPSWNLYSFGILALFSFFQVMQWPLLPKFLDMFYHLNVMKGFSQAGGFSSVAFWEYAPGGRPHLYPPLLHWIMLLIYKAGVSAIDVGRTVDLGLYPVLMVSFWDLVRKVHSNRVAFWALIIFSSSYSLYISVITLPAFSLGFIWILWGLRAFYDSQWIRSGFFLALCFYTHTLAGWLLCLIYFAAYILKQGRTVGGLAKVYALGLGLALPLLVFQWSHRNFFGFVRMNENNFIQIDLWVYSCAALLLFLRAASNGRIPYPLNLPLALWLGSFPMALTHPIRFLYGPGLLGLVWISALAADQGLSRLAEKTSYKQNFKGVLIPLLFVVFIQGVSPVLHIDRESKKAELEFFGRSLNRYLTADSRINFTSKGFSIYFHEPYREIAQIIRENSNPDEILWTDFPYTAGILSILSDRVTSCAMLPEVAPYQRQADPLADARIVVWFKDRDLKPQAGMLEAVKRYHLSLIKETEMAYVLQNPSGYKKASIPNRP